MGILLGIANGTHRLDCTMCVAEALSLTDIVAALRRMLQQNEPPVGASPVSAVETGLRNYVYSQTGKSVR